MSDDVIPPKPPDEQSIFLGGGRLAAKDPRDEKYLLPKRAAQDSTRTYRHWFVPPALDQGRTSQCVGYSTHMLLRAGPILNSQGIPAPKEIYDEAQKIDEWPGTSYEGTSVRAGVKFLASKGYIASYYWAFSAAPLVSHLLNVGPAVIGINYYSGMFNPDKFGFIQPTGTIEGGHAILVSGVNLKEQTPAGDIGSVTMVNSWSPKWGINGRCKLSIKDLDRLIKEDGEAAVVFEQKNPLFVAS